jgi:site-specific DNA-methyltransferase (adenine-specific)
MEDGKLMLVDGHLRAETTPEMEVPVLVLDLDEKEADLLLATLDPMAGLAELNAQALKALLGELAPESESVEALLESLAHDAKISFEKDELPETPEPQLDRAEELQATWGTALGQVWEIPSGSAKDATHRILCGDSRNVADVEALMAGAKAQAVLTDPPYGVEYEGKTKDALRIENDGSDGLEPLLRAALGNAMSACAPGAVWYVAAPAGPQFYEFATVLRELGVWRQTLVWVKDQFVMGHSDYHYRHEVLFYGWTDGKHRRPPDRCRDTVWEIPRPKASREHPTMKPVELFARAAQTSTKKGALILEPFLGSGTTMVAAEATGRVCHGIELAPKYLAVTLQRMADMGLEPRLTNGKTRTKKIADKHQTVTRKSRKAGAACE